MHFAYNKKAGEWTCALASWEKLSAAKTKRLPYSSGRADFSYLTHHMAGRLVSAVALDGHK